MKINGHNLTEITTGDDCYKYYRCKECGLILFKYGKEYLTSLENQKGIGQIPIEQISCNEWIIREIIK